MRTIELINAYAYKRTANITVAMYVNGEDMTIFSWDAEENRHPDDGSYGNICHYIPDDIAKAEVENFDIIPQHLVSGNDIIKLGNTETLYIVIPTYSNLYKYMEDDNYPFI